jgi:hypothetical protein
MNIMPTHIWILVTIKYGRHELFLNSGSDSFSSKKSRRSYVPGLLKHCLASNNINMSIYVFIDIWWYIPKLTGIVIVVLTTSVV